MSLNIKQRKQEHTLLIQSLKIKQPEVKMLWHYPFMDTRDTMGKIDYIYKLFSKFG